MLLDKIPDMVKYVEIGSEKNFYYGFIGYNNKWKIIKVTIIYENNSNNFEAIYEYPYGVDEYMFNWDDLDTLKFCRKYSNISKDSYGI